MGAERFWQRLFLTDHPMLARLWGPLVGPIVAMLGFVCSIGNVPLAAVLWNGGISFGGVMAFIFADLIVLPILIIYRKYYGTRMMLRTAGHLLRRDGHRRIHRRIAFRRSGSHPDTAQREGDAGGHRWNYTTWLNIVFLVVAAVLVIRFISTGGIPMLQMMGGAPDDAPPDSADDSNAVRGSHAAHGQER